MDSDFSAIDDLSCTLLPKQCPSPAHADPQQRAAEEARWDKLGIATRSYATRAPRLFSFPPGAAQPAWDLMESWRVIRDWPQGATSPLHAACYRACAGGPFKIPSDVAIQTTAQALGIEPWDNDGIVNTASMLWPDYGDTRLLEADHMDIVGHFCRAKAGTARRYDLLGSGARFGAHEFGKLWDEIFSFCA